MNRQCLKLLVHLRRTKCFDKLNASVLKNSLFEPNLCQKSSVFEKFNHLKFRSSVRFCQYLQTRNTSSDSGGDENKKKPPVLMDFVAVNRPQILLTIKSWILAKFIVQPYLDRDFTLTDFTIGAKQAMSLVSSYLSQGDFQSLQGLVSDDAISEIKENFSAFNVKERHDLFIKITDILFAFPYQVGIIFDDNSQKRFAEITVVYHCMKDLEKITSQGRDVSIEMGFKEQVKEDIQICNYRFIREYTKGVESDWVINRLGHFKVCHFED